MKYYYSGVASWKWYFPFHYAPFASDLRNIERFQKDIKFELATPFKPVEQLLGVLPSDSAHAVPKKARELMCDPNSAIIDFYPKDVPCDPNGKAMPWLWVVLLPFIDEKRLLEALKPTESGWTAAEKRLNTPCAGDACLFVHKDHPLSDLVRQGAEKKKALGDAARWGGFTGEVFPPVEEDLCEEGAEVRIGTRSVATKCRKATVPP